MPLTLRVMSRRTVVSLACGVAVFSAFAAAADDPRSSFGERVRSFSHALLEKGRTAVKTANSEASRAKGELHREVSARTNATVERTRSAAGRWMSDRLRLKPAREANYGLTFITATNARAPASHVSLQEGERIVILVHGLDEVGHIWCDLIPQLHARGLTVGRFEYPNDGPISRSADLLAESLREVRQAGLERVDIIAHSMGGLVARDVLTRRDYYAGDGAGAGAKRFPAIDRLIMVGTPNHGAAIARLRPAIEWREHLAAALQSGANLRSLMKSDGSGEAGRDLLPGSAYLRELNARPMPRHTRISVIAGEIVDPTPNRSARTTVSLANTCESLGMPTWLTDAAATHTQRAIESVAGFASHNLGDGCVSIESARLDGAADFARVRGSHVGMLMRIGWERDQPPAISVILPRLEDPLPSVAAGDGASSVHPVHGAHASAEPDR